MATPKRPYIPWKIRWKVAKRQLGETKPHVVGMLSASVGGYQERTEIALRGLGFVKPQLDHDPALILRQQFKNGRGEIIRYVPDANNPNHLIYRESDKHLEKTIGRKAGAERTVTTKGSDIGIKAKFDRLEGRTKKRPKQKIRSRGFPKPKERRSRW